MKRNVQGRAERLRQAGLKATAPRLLILAALEGDRSHPTAEELFERLRRAHPSLSLSTVYNTLESFLHSGLCQRVNVDGSLRVDGVNDVHDHAICRRCGRVFDINGRRAPLADLRARLPRNVSLHGVRVQYDVTCADCRAEERSRTPKPIPTGG